MKRAHGHLAFAFVAAALSVLTAGEALRLQHAQRINTAVAEWTTAPIPDPHAADHLPLVVEAVLIVKVKKRIPDHLEEISDA